MKRTAQSASRTIRVPLSALSGGAMLINGRGLIVQTNGRARRLFGQPEVKLAGRFIGDLVPDLRPADLEALPLSDRRTHRREMRGLRANGEQMQLRIGLRRVHSAGTTAFLVTVSDLTQRKLLEASMRDGRYGFRQLAAALPQILWTCGPNGSAEYFGPQWTSFTGVALAACLGWGWLDQLHEDDRPAVAGAWRAAIAAGRTFKTEFRVRRHDGEIHWFESAIVPMRDTKENLVRWIGTIQDIHEARANRMALIEERDRVARLVASVPGAVFAFRLKPDGTSSFPLASPGLKDFVGVPAAELPQGVQEHLPHINPDDRARVRASIIASARDLTPWQGEWRLNHPVRGEIWVESRSVPIREADGSTLWYGIMMDVTQRKRDEDELKRSQARLRAAVMASGIGTWIWDVVSDRLWWDDVLLKLFDRTREEVEKGGIMGAAAFVEPEDRPHIAAALSAVSAGKTDRIALEYRSARHDKALQWIAVNGQVDRDANGRMVSVTGACMDITARKRAEEAQRHTQKVEALGTLAGGIAHDFNNLLLAIAGNTRLAMADLPAHHAVQQNLAEIDKASLRATDLVHRILAFSRQSEPRREVTRLQGTVEEALRLLRAAVPAMIEIRANFSAATPDVSADSTQIHQIIMNLVTNAAHAIGEDGGIITVDLDRADVDGPLPGGPELHAGSYAHIRVSDTGIGMDKQTLDRIFDPFFTTKPVGTGTGLGLSVVHGIVRSHDGVISVRSERGRGATFDLYFPAASQTGAQLARAAPGARPGKGQRVMYVDDEDALVFLATRMLVRMGYAITGFVDPGKALLTFQDNPAAFDVVITDVSMPGMSGFHLARALLAVRPDIPIVMTSGYIRPQDRDSAEQIGVRELILKPDTIEELGRTLERVFAKQGLT